MNVKCPLMFRGIGLQVLLNVLDELVLQGPKRVMSTPQHQPCGYSKVVKCFSSDNITDERREIPIRNNVCVLSSKDDKRLRPARNPWVIVQVPPLCLNKTDGMLKFLGNRHGVSRLGPGVEASEEGVEH